MSQSRRMEYILTGKEYLHYRGEVDVFLILEITHIKETQTHQTNTQNKLHSSAIYGEYQPQELRECTTYYVAKHF